MSEQKTHAEIIAEMRFHGQQNIDAEKDKPEYGILTMEGRITQNYAAELDAAHKREIEDAERRGNHAATKAICETIEKVGPLYDAESVGNAAKLREVVGDLLYMAERYVKKTPATESVIFDAKTKKEIRTVNYYDVIAKAQAALAAPPRNCDLYADEQSAWEAFSEKRQGPDSSTEEYEQWLFEKATA